MAIQLQSGSGLTGARAFEPTYIQRPDTKFYWRLPQNMPGRQLLVAIWRWM